MSISKITANVSAVAIDGKALLIEGAPGSGKSGLALALIDRGAELIGDDGVRLTRNDKTVIVSPPPNISGKLEIRGVGIVELSTAEAPLSLILVIDDAAPRYPEATAKRDVLGQPVPVLPFHAGDANQALRAEWALRMHGLSF
jgi:hypothetical protein